LFNLYTLQYDTLLLLIVILIAYYRTTEIQATIPPQKEIDETTFTVCLIFNLVNLWAIVYNHIHKYINYIINYIVYIVYIH